MKFFSLLLIVLSIIVVFIVFCRNKKRIIETFKNNVMTDFTYLKPSVLELQNSLYDPIIHRPPEQMVRNYNSPCTNSLYPNRTSKYGKGDMTVPCSAYNEAKYYAMRPILNSNTYHDMLEILFEHIKDKNIEIDDEEKLVNPKEFSDGDEYSKIKKFIMKKINKAKDTIPVFVEYKKRDTWDGEQFSFLNEKLFIFQNIDLSSLSQQERANLAKNGKHVENKKIIISFTLYNTLRSLSTDIIATVLFVNGEYKLKDIHFSSQKDDSKLQGVNIGKKSASIVDQEYPCMNGGPQWIYGNTIENVTFNSSGFHSNNPNNNYVIEGGVPESLLGVLEKCNDGYLLECGSANRLPGGSDTTVYPNYPDTSEQWTYK